MRAHRDSPAQRRAQLGRHGARQPVVAGTAGTARRIAPREVLEQLSGSRAVECVGGQRGAQRPRAVLQREGDDDENEQDGQQGCPVDARVQHRRADCRPFARAGNRRLSWASGLVLMRQMADRAPRILLVDDEESIQTLLSYPLRKDGYEVVLAGDGAQALKRFDEASFDLVVLDVMMPVLDGLEVCKRLRARSTVPIIMLTAKSDEVDTIVGLELGADDYITKPFSVREFRSRVKAALRGRRSRARRRRGRGAAGDPRAADRPGGAP